MVNYDILDEACVARQECIMTSLQNESSCGFGLEYVSLLQSSKEQYYKFSSLSQTGNCHFKFGCITLQGASNFITR